MKLVTSKVISSSYKRFKACVQILPPTSSFSEDALDIAQRFLELFIFLRGQEFCNDINTKMSIRTTLWKREELAHHSLFPVILI